MMMFTPVKAWQPDMLCLRQLRHLKYLGNIPIVRLSDNQFVQQCRARDDREKKIKFSFLCLNLKSEQEGPHETIQTEVTGLELCVRNIGGNYCAISKK